MQTAVRWKESPNHSQTVPETAIKRSASCQFLPAVKPPDPHDEPLQVFKDLLTVEIWEVLRASQWRTFAGNGQLIKESEHGFSFFNLLKGAVVGSKKQRMLNVINSGD